MFVQSLTHGVPILIGISKFNLNKFNGFGLGWQQNKATENKLSQNFYYFLIILIKIFPHCVVQICTFIILLINTEEEGMQEIGQAGEKEHAGLVSTETGHPREDPSKCMCAHIHTIHSPHDL